MNSGHAHADLLSLQINSGGTPLIVDPGTYTYAGRSRDYFREADRHSIIKVDGHYPAATDDVFKWKTVPRHRLIRWSSAPKYDYVCGRMEADGTGWKHTREIFFIKPDLFFIVDTLDGSGEHDIEVRFALNDSEWSINGKACLRAPGPIPCSIEYAGLDDFRPKLSDSWVSPCYGKKLPSLTLSFNGAGKLPYRSAVLVNLSDDKYRVEVSDRTHGGRFKIVSANTGTVIFEYKQPD